MNDAETAWVAGLLEGEGSFYLVKAKRPARTYLYPAVACTMTDEDVVRRLQETTGLGRVTGPYVRKLEGLRKPCWRWQVQRGQEARQLMQAVLPWMGQRRTERIREVLG